MRDRVAQAREVLVPDDAVLLPGLVDSHVHVNEPGRTEWEGFRSATLAAAAGGVTTIVDMPLNSLPPTTTAEALAIKRAAAAPSAFIDIGFWGGAVPDSLGALAPLHEAGVFGFKCFLSPSGVDEFPHLDRAQLLAAMEEIASLGSRLIVHAEDPALLGDDGALGRGYDAFLASRPAASEASAIDAVIDAARRTGARAHILHLSDAHSLPAIRAAKAEGVALTVETCPHYLTIVAEEIPDGASEFKCCPPIRDAANRDLLWAGVVDGTIDAIVSDHSPEHGRSQALRRRRLRPRVGRDRGPAGRSVGGVDRGAGPRHPAGDDPAAVHDRAGGRRRTRPARASSHPGAPAHLTVFGVDDPLPHRRRAAAPQEPDHGLRPPHAHRPDPPHVAARQVDLQRDRGRRRRGAAVPRQAARPAAVGAHDAYSGLERARHADETWMQLDGGMRPSSRSCSRATATSRATTTCARRPTRCCGDGCRARRMPRSCASRPVSPSPSTR